MKNFFVPFLLALFFFSFCDDIVSNDVELDKEFDLNIREQAVLIEENFSLIFKDVTEDSRCPEDVTCIWAGNASLQFFTKNTASIINTYSEPHSFETNGYNIKLISLSPYPNSKKSIKKEDYTVTLVLTER